jgi:hypothetical protein
MHSSEQRRGAHLESARAQLQREPPESFCYLLTHVRCVPSLVQPRQRTDQKDVSVFEVIKNEEIAPELHRMVVDAPRIAKARRPGQFVIVRGGATVILAMGDGKEAARSIDELLTQTATSA